MDLDKKKNWAVQKIRKAPDSDDIESIMRRLVDKLIDENITGPGLSIFMQRLHIELCKIKTGGSDFIELNNIKRAIEITEMYGKALGIKVFFYTLN